MTQYELEKAVKDGKTIMMKKYRFYGMWSDSKKVSGEIALKKSKILVSGGWCPYSFEIYK